MHGRNKVVFLPVETGSLKAVYMLALAALDATHRVHEALMGDLAEAVFEAYVDSRCPPMPLSAAQTEELAVFSLELLDQGALENATVRH